MIYGSGSQSGGHEPLGGAQNCVLSEYWGFINQLFVMHKYNLQVHSDYFTILIDWLLFCSVGTEYSPVYY